MENKEIISKLSKEEKIKELGGDSSWYLFPLEEYGLNRVHFSDGPYGLREDLSSETLFGKGVDSICFPTSSLTAASFDRELLYKLGKTLGQEARNRNIHCVLGPAINIKRSPLCGRNFEYMSEDPLLTGELAASYIKGMEEEGVATSLKHFALNNQESFRMTINSICDIRTMREIYLKGFEIAIKKGNPGTIMASYNRVNGDYACENKYLLKDILRDEWGYKGLVISDWGAVNDPVKAIKNGLNEIMPIATTNQYKKISEAYDKDDELQNAVDESLNYTFDFIKKYQDTKPCDFDIEKGHEIAVDIAKESIVLLKNEDKILPLKKREKVAFIGEYALTPHYKGGGSSNVTPYKLVTPIEVVENGDYNVTFVKGFSAIKDEVDLDLEDEALDLAKKSDKVVLFMGTNNDIESENYDRKNLDLFANQISLLNKIYEVNKNIVVVLQNGAPVEMPFVNKTKGIVELYLAGEGVGEAIMSVLYGETNPSGRLAETFPLKNNTLPNFTYFHSNPCAATYRESIYVGYRYFETKNIPVLFPFGYGLSYSKFSYSEFNGTFAENSSKNDYKIKLTCKVSNDSDIDGKDVIQVYISKPNDKVFNAKYELVDFKKVLIKAHETKTVEFELDRHALEYFDVNLNKWNVQNGTYKIYVSKNSHEHLFEYQFEVKNEQEILGYDKETLKKYFNCDVRFLTFEEFAKLFNNDKLLRSFKKPEKFDMNSTFTDIKCTRAGRMFYKLVTSREELKSNKLVYAAITEMPFRALCTFGTSFDEKLFKPIIRAANHKCVLINFLVFIIKFAKAGKRAKF